MLPYQTLPFRALHLVPARVCFSPACAGETLQEPLFHRVPVPDAIGIEYAYDVELTQGFYLLLLTYALWRGVLAPLLLAADDE